MVAAKINVAELTRIEAITSMFGWKMTLSVTSPAFLVIYVKDKIFKVELE